MKCYRVGAPLGIQTLVEIEIFLKSYDFFLLVVLCGLGLLWRQDRFGQFALRRLNSAP